MTKEALATVSKIIAERSGAPHDSVARDAEKFCAASQVEYHPLACDVVEAAYTSKSANAPNICTHVSQAVRDAADEQLAALSAPEPKKAKE